MPLLWLILIPLTGALAIAAAPEAMARRIATIVSFIAFGVTAAVMAMFDWSDAGSFQFAWSLPLIAEPEISISLGAESVAMWLILLTGFLGPLCVLGSFTAIVDRQKTYYAWLMGLQAAMVGVFAARDLVFFYACFEFTLLPMYVLISLYGSTNRRKAATKFFLYTFTGSIIALAGFVYVAWVHASGSGGVWTFDIAALERAARGMSGREQALVLGAMLAGFAVKVPLFPFHTWLPLAHTEAPTAGSVILAGVLLKLGTYAIWRFVLPFVPGAVNEYAAVIAVICIIGILYGGLICWVQRDVKKLVAYSSVAHLGFCMLGMFALNAIGAGGSILYMINHGLSTGALFFCIGFMYERYHTRSLDELGGLMKKMPVWSFFLVFFTMASVGLPGLNGFISEFMCLLGAFQSGAAALGPGGTGGHLGPWFAAVAGSGMIVAAIYLLYMVGRIVFGPYKEPQGHHHHGPLPVDLCRREIAVLAPLAVACIALGVLPAPVIRTIEAPIENMLAAVRAAPGAHAAAATPIPPTVTMGGEVRP